MMNQISENYANISMAVKVLKDSGFIEEQSMLDVLCRVLRTKKALNGAEADTDTIYRTMQESAASLPRFPGDAELFAQLYHTLSSLESSNILAWLHVIREERMPSPIEPLVKLFEEHITAKTKTVLIPECEQYTYALLGMIQRHPDIAFTLTVSGEIYAELLSEAYAPYSNAAIQIADIYSPNLPLGRFDLILELPLFGRIKDIDTGDFLCRDMELIAAQNLLSHIQDDGDLVILLLPRVTFSRDADPFRKYVKDHYPIREVSALPSGILPGSAIKTFLFVFSAGTMKNIVLKKYEHKKAIRKNSVPPELHIDKECRLTKKEWDAFNSWNINLALAESDPDIKAFRKSPVKKMLLHQAADTFRGKSIQAKTKSGNIGIINLSDLTDNGIDYSHLDRITEEERKVSRYILKTGDVLITARGTLLKIAIFEEQDMICIPTSNIIVIRPHDFLNSTYLKLFLESSAGKKMLDGLCRGDFIINLNYEDLGFLEIPVLPREEQDKITREYTAGLKRYTKAIETATKDWDNLYKKLQTELY